MYRQCTTEKTASQQKTFQDALLFAMNELSYEDISVTNLCRQTGLSRNVFYRLFDNKDDVLNSLIDFRFMECSQFLSSDDIQENLLEYFSFWKSQKNLLDILDRNNLDNILISRCNFFCHETSSSMRKFIPNKWVDYDTEIFTFYINGFIGLMFHWYHTGFVKSAEEMAQLAYDFLLCPPIQGK